MTYKTFGVGGDYADLGLAWDYLVSLGTLGDDYEFTQVSDFTDSKGVAGGASKLVTFNTHSVTFRNPNGYSITTAYPYNFRDNGAGASLNDVLILDGLKITTSITSGTLIYAAPWFASNSMTVFYKNLCLKGGGKVFATTGITRLRWGNSTHILNCRITNFYTGIACYTIEVNTSGTDFVVENCSIYDCRDGINLGATTAARNSTIRNTVSFGNLDKDFTTGGAHHTITHCADGDNSIASCGGILSGNITGIVTGDFLSVTYSNANFLKIAIDTTLHEIGTTSISTWNTADVDGNPRPNALSLVSIGVYEPVIISGVSDVIVLQKGILGFKLETVPGSVETLTAADYNKSVYDVQVVPNIESYIQSVCGGNFSKWPSIAGKRSCAVNFAVDIYGMSSPATPPTYFEILRACGWKQIVHGSTGVSIRPDSLYNNITATIEVAYDNDNPDGPSQLVYRISGAMGIVKIIGKAGLPIKLEFSFIGSLEEIITRAYVDRISGLTFDSAFPAALLEANINIFDFNIKTDSFEFSSNEVINQFSDIFSVSGFGGSRVVDRLLSGKIKIDQFYPDGDIIEFEDGVLEFEDGVIEY